jgi:quercetin dioxygenase-like cupin family protein
MKVQPKAATIKNSPEQFVGDAWVRFAPGAHSNWHSHALGRTLHVVAGVGLVQARGGEVIEIHPGHTIVTPPGEEHWHGATPDDFMEHLALMDIPDDLSTATTWLEPVSDAEYHCP